ncbi:hypothetical protein BT69DRAFT_1305143, partial [Atractiella rhizophila]
TRDLTALGSPGQLKLKKNKNGRRLTMAIEGLRAHVDNSSANHFLNLEEVLGLVEEVTKTNMSSIIKLAKGIQFDESKIPESLKTLEDRIAIREEEDQKKILDSLKEVISERKKREEEMKRIKEETMKTMEGTDKRRRRSVPMVDKVWEYIKRIMEEEEDREYGRHEPWKGYYGGKSRNMMPFKRFKTKFRVWLKQWEAFSVNFRRIMVEDGIMVGEEDMVTITGEEEVEDMEEGLDETTDPKRIKISKRPPRLERIQPLYQPNQKRRERKQQLFPPALGTRFETGVIISDQKEETYVAVQEPEPVEEIKMKTTMMQEKNTPSEEDQKGLLQMKEELRVAEVIVEKYAPSLLEVLRKGVGRKMVDSTQEAIQASLWLTSSYSITGVNGLTSAIAGIVENVDINLGSMTIPQHFFVTPSITHSIILGQAFLHDSKAFLNYDTPDDSIIISVRQSYHRLHYKIPAENLKWQYRNLDDVALGKITTESIEEKEEEVEN